jgi:Ca-activated chloride channel family protein
MIFAKINEYWWLIILILVVGFSAKKWLINEFLWRSTPLFKYNINYKTSIKSIWLRTIIIFIGLIFLLLAVWQPQWGKNIQKNKRKGLDVVFTVDVSKSMKALDFSQHNQLISRLDAAKYLINEFIKKRPQDRIGLIEFAGESFVASPLTLDHNVFQTFLENISSNDLGKQGTNLAEAIAISIGRLDIQTTTKRGKTILLFSDGDETINSEINKMAKLAQNKGIKIYTIGIGSTEGSPIPNGQDVFGQIIYKKYKGKTVLAKLNPKPLKKIAQITNGKYFHAENINDLKNLEKKLNNLPQKILTEETISPQNEQYLIFTWIGLILFVIGFLDLKQFINLKKQ